MFTPQFTDYRPTISPITILTTAPHHHHTNIPLPPSYHHTILPPHLITIIPTYPYHHLTIILHNHSTQLSYTLNFQKPLPQDLKTKTHPTKTPKHKKKSEAPPIPHTSHPIPPHYTFTPILNPPNKSTLHTRNTQSTSQIPRRNPKYNPKHKAPPKSHTEILNTIQAKAS